MAVFASLFGKLAQRLAPGNIDETLRSHVGAVPNPLSERSKRLQSRVSAPTALLAVGSVCTLRMAR